MNLAALLLLCVATTAAPDDDASLPEIVVTRDDTTITASCRLRFLDVPLPDAGDDGVVRIAAPGVRVVFAEDTVLQGAGPAVDPDALTGVGVFVDGVADVTLVGARVRGYRVGILARDADRLTIDGARLTDLRRDRLRSTPEAPDDGADWLAPHDNDEGQWLRRYGAALAIERSESPRVRGVVVRRAQNGIVLDRVSGARVFDNDASFLSGWGLALWRTNTSRITRNAFDFCVRGYSHGVYNRGQDSAGVLMFEQCRANVFAENSVTHGGDGVFAFAGREALGERDGRARDGIDANLFVGNDLSYAVAHGLELTFSADNVVLANRFAGNAICGIWGGYSRRTSILFNTFERNGEAGYGLERGGVNIEHGRANVIYGNTFREDRCGVHLWWDEDAAIAATPWAAERGTACAENEVRANVFLGVDVGIHLRECDEVVLAANAFVGAREPHRVERTATVEDEASTALPPALPPLVEIEGATRPVGARRALAGRENIVMTEWGPWDHASPLLTRVVARPDRHEYRLARIPAGSVPHVHGEVIVERSAERIRCLAPAGHGVWRYAIEVPGVVPPLRASGVLQRLGWDVTVFAWDVDPREDVAAWRAAADGVDAARFTVDALALRYGHGGPGTLDATPEAADALPADRFGTLARAEVPLAAGTWRIRTLSDDGLRVRVDGELVIDEWTWHAPTPHDARVHLDTARTVVLEVEHFELDGYAVLEVELTPEASEAR